MRADGEDGAGTPARRGSLSGRKYLGASRVRGAAPWHPREATVALLVQVEAVLDSYAFPITLRQIFYRLVGLGHLVKTEQSYARLQEHLNRARRAGRIGWWRIADDTLVAYGPLVHDGASAYTEWAIRRVRSRAVFLAAWLATQPVRPLLWCESQGMAASLRSALGRLGWPVQVLTTSGTDPVRPKHDTALGAVDRFQTSGQRTVIGHISDLDEAGLAIADAFDEDVRAFAESYDPRPCVTVERVALTPRQVNHFKLPPNPGKPAKMIETGPYAGRLWVPPGDTMAESVQAEALPPDGLVREVRTWLRGHVDLRALHRSRGEHSAARQRVDDRLSDLVDEWEWEDEA